MTEPANTTTMDVEITPFGNMDYAQMRKEYAANDAYQAKMARFRSKMNTLKSQSNKTKPRENNTMVTYMKNDFGQKQMQQGIPISVSGGKKTGKANNTSKISD